MSQSSLKPGSFVEINTLKENFSGTILPSTNNKIVSLKLNNGYNIGIEKNKIKKIKIINKKQQKPNQNLIKQDKNLPKIVVIHTGGTIASKVDYKTGGVSASFTSDDLLSLFPDLKNIAYIDSIFLSNIMSEDIRFSHYQDLCKEIQKQLKKNPKGIIIGHGTDTIALTAAALAFMIENPPIPIILVGAQRSSDRGGSDASLNLLSASYFITKSNFKGIAICMYKNSSDETCLILPPTKTRKLHTSRRDAFKPVNDTPIAEVNYRKQEIKFLKPQEENNNKLIIKDKFQNKVAIIKTHPNMFPDLINTLTSKKYKGLILEGTGIGQAPTNIKENIPNYNALKKFIKSGGIILLTSQCIFGRVHENIYANCRRLKEIGVIFGQDMLTETAFIKLAWLLGNFNKKQALELLNKNLRGEINSRILPDQYFEEK